MKTTALLSFTALLSCTLGCEVPEMEVSTGPAAVEKQAEKTEKTELFGKEDWYLPDGRVDMTGVPDEPPMTTSGRSSGTRAVIAREMASPPWTRERMIERRRAALQRLSATPVPAKCTTASAPANTAVSGAPSSPCSGSQ